MKQESVLIKISLGIDVAAILALAIYFAVVVPSAPVTGLGGLLILSPPIFGVFGLITAIAGVRKNRTALGVALIMINLIFLLWLPLFWIGGTLLFGV